MRSRRTPRPVGKPGVFAAAQTAAFDDARALAVEMASGIPSCHFDAMRAGLVLGRSETAYRWVGVWLATLDGGGWAPSSWAQVLITDRRLLCRCGDGRLLSLSWTDVTGLQIALYRQRVIVNYGDETPIAWMGYEAAALAVGAVAGVYGFGSLVTHSALSPLRTNRR